MGKATRWLKSLLSRKKDSEDRRKNSSSPSFESREKKRWSFCSRRPAAPGGYDMNEEDKRALAVAAAAATAASAAVMAAKAAMVRLKSINREGTRNSYIRAFAAIRIQTAFRGYLARRVLAALKALVKLQAVIRGHLVRKKASATLHQLRALLKAQMFSLAQQRSLFSIRGGRRSFERWKHNGTENSPKIIEMDAYLPKSRSFRATELQPVDELITSPLPPRLSIPSHRASFKDYRWSLCSEKGRLYARTAVTAQNTHRFKAAETTATRTGSPNYMGITRSFSAKVRSQSAPKHRWEMPRYLPETPNCRPETARSKEKAPADVKWEEARGGLNGYWMRRSFSEMRDGCNLKRGMAGKLEEASEMSRELARDYYMDTMW